MIISNWGNSYKSGVTSNLAAISIMGVLDSTFKITLLENHYNEKSISNCILYSPQKNLVMEREVFYLGQGNKDCLINCVSMLTNKKKTEYERLEIMEGRLFYIPQILFKDYAYELNLWNKLFPLVHEISNSESLVIVDTEFNSNRSSIQILNDVELVIVNLKQDIDSVIEFFQNYSSLIDKAVFVIGKYKRCREDKLKKMLFDKGVKKERIGVILYNDEFQIALEEGRGVEFIISHYKCKRGSYNYTFIRELKNTTRMILNRVSEIQKEIDLGMR